MKTLQQKLNEAANIDKMGADTVAQLDRINRNIAYRVRQVENCLISEAEAVHLVKTGTYIV